MKKAVLVLLALLGVLIVPGSVLAQGGDGAPIALEYGVPAQGAISNEVYEFQYSFMATAGDMVYVSAVEISNTYLPLELTLRNSKGQIVAERERHSIYYTLPFEVPEDGEYLIDLTRSGGEDSTSTGNFVVIVDKAEYKTLEAGTITDTLPEPAAVHFYTYTGTENEIVSIAAQGSGLEFVLVKPDGYSMKSRGPTNDPIEPFSLLPTDGEYLLLIQTENLEGGNYTLTFGTFEPTDIEAGESVDGEIGPDLPASYYRIYASPDNLLRLEVASEDPDFDGEVGIYNVSGSRQTTVYNSDETEYKLLLEPWVVREEGFYFLAVTPDAGLESAAAYQLTTRESELELLELGIPLSGELNDDNTHDGYALEAAADQVSTIQVRQLDGTCTPAITVRNRETTGFRVTSNRWSADYSAQIIFPEAGYYIFQIERTSYNDECTYELLVSETMAAEAE